MDAELLALQQLFQATQDAKTTLRLSERNVVELVSKLQDLQLLGFDLLHTVSGKEYITQERLRCEVEAEVGRLGRVSLVDLATSIGVELIHCEKIIEQLVHNDSELMFVQGEVLSTSYWDAVAEEVNEKLQGNGQISVGELARQFTVGTELLTRMLESRIGTSIHGKLEGGQLYTPAYVARIRSMVRGAVRAIMVPTPLSTIWALLQKELRQGEDTSSVAGSGDIGLFHSVLKGLIADGDVQGSLRGGGSSWTPTDLVLSASLWAVSEVWGSQMSHSSASSTSKRVSMMVFAHSQRESVEAFFSQNGYISYGVLRKLAISQPKVYLQEKYSEGTPLDTVFVHASLINILDAAAEEAIVGSGWVDVVPLSPTSFSITDVEKMLVFCPTVQKAKKDSTGVILLGTCVVSTAFIKVLVEKLEVDVQSLVQKNAESQAKRSGKKEHDHPGIEKAVSGNKTTSVGRDMDADDDNNRGKNSRRKKAAYGLQTSKTAVKDDSTEDILGKGGKSKRKSGRSKGGNSLFVAEAGVGANKTSKGGGSTKGGVSAEDAEMPSQDQIAEKILHWFPEMESAGLEEGNGIGSLAAALAAWVRPSVLLSWTASKHACCSAIAEDRRRKLDNIQQKIDESYASLQLFSKALDLFEGDQITTVNLHRHLLRSTATELADFFLFVQDVDRGIEDGLGNENLDSLVPLEPLSSAQRLSLAKCISDSELSSKALEMVESLEGKDIGVFEAAFEAVMSESGLRLKRLDKKSEKFLLHSHGKHLSLQVEEEKDPVGLLPKVVGLLYIQVHGRALQAPGRSMASAVARLKSGMSEASHQILVNYQLATVQLLTMLSSATLDERNCTSDRIHTKREALESCMPELKAIVLPTSTVLSRENAATS